MEEWKINPTYPAYEISSFGNVRNIKTKKILKTKITRTGYVHINLNKATGIRLHRLVAETFIPNSNGKLPVHHIDHNKTNNRVENLKWCTPSENFNYSIDYYFKKMLHKNVSEILASLSQDSTKEEYFNAIVSFFGLEDLLNNSKGTG